MTRPTDRPAGAGASLCHVCGVPALEVIAGYGAFQRVTSDCKPWPAGGQLGVCRTCGCIQKIINARWREEIGRIYADYAIYHQSGGIEQAVFEQSSGRPISRSGGLVQRLRRDAGLPARGRLLDVGCGNGALLSVFQALIPGWVLAGTELNDKYRAVVEQIPEVEALYTCPPAQIPGSFDLITLMHALEHIPDPTRLLGELREKLAPGGRLLVEVPDHLQNPFDLLIADHSTHFTRTTLAAVIERAGFQVDSVATDWMPKELTALARRGTPGPPAGPPPPSSSAAQSLAWLHTVATAARAVAAAGNFGAFGTSIAATWLDSELERPADFFVDEDPSRLGKSHLGRPIRHPREITAGSHIFVALPAPLAHAVRARLERGDGQGTYHVPPPFPASPCLPAPVADQ